MRSPRPEVDGVQPIAENQLVQETLAPLESNRRPRGASALFWVVRRSLRWSAISSSRCPDLSCPARYTTKGSERKAFLILACYGGAMTVVRFRASFLAPCITSVETFRLTAPDRSTISSVSRRPHRPRPRVATLREVHGELAVMSSKTRESPCERR